VGRGDSNRIGGRLIVMKENPKKLRRLESEGGGERERSEGSCSAQTCAEKIEAGRSRFGQETFSRTPARK